MRELMLSFQKPLIKTAWRDARFRRHWQWADWALDGRRACHLCARQENSLFDFVELVRAWDDEWETVVYECMDHGGKDGKVLTSCDTGLDVLVPPSKSAWLIRVRDWFQQIVYVVAVVLRFVWFLASGGFCIVVLSNDVAYRLVAAIVVGWREWRQRGWGTDYELFDMWCSHKGNRYS